MSDIIVYFIAVISWVQSILWYHNSVNEIILWYHIWYMTYDIIDQCSICLAVALGSPRCGSGLTATLARLCRPEPALAETLAPYPLRLRDRRHAGAAPAVAPRATSRCSPRRVRLDVHLVEPAAAGLLARSRCVSAEASPRRRSSLKRCGIVG